MKWIHSLKEIKQFLDEDEEILWSHKEIINLLSFIPKGIIAVIVYIVVLLILSTIYIVLGSIIGAILMLLFCIIGVVLSVTIMIKSYRKRTKTIQLNPTQLKKYEFFYLLTNKRYIRKNFFFNFERDLSIFPNKVLEQIGDTIFLNFSSIEIIIVDYVLKEINFKIKNFIKRRDFFLRFNEKDEMDNAMEIIRSVIPLEIMEKKIDLYTKFIQKVK